MYIHILFNTYIRSGSRRLCHTGGNRSFNLHNHDVIISRHVVKTRLNLHCYTCQPHVILTSVYSSTSHKNAVNIRVRAPLSCAFSDTAHLSDIFKDTRPTLIHSSSTLAFLFGGLVSAEGGCLFSWSVLPANIITSFNSFSVLSTNGEFPVKVRMHGISRPPWGRSLEYLLPPVTRQEIEPFPRKIANK